MSKSYTVQAACRPQRLPRPCRIAFTQAIWYHYGHHNLPLAGGRRYDHSRGSTFPPHCEMSDSHNAAPGEMRQRLTCCLYREVPLRRGLVTPLSPPFQSSLIQSISRKREAPMSMIRLLDHQDLRRSQVTRDGLYLATALSVTSMHRPWTVHWLPPYRQSAQRHLFSWSHRRRAKQRPPAPCMTDT